MTDPHHESSSSRLNSGPYQTPRSPFPSTYIDPSSLRPLITPASLKREMEEYLERANARRNYEQERQRGLAEAQRIEEEHASRLCAEEREERYKLAKARREAERERLAFERREQDRQERARKAEIEETHRRIGERRECEQRRQLERGELF